MKKKKPPIVLGAMLLILLGSVAAMNAATNQPDPQQLAIKKMQEQQEKEAREAGTLDQFQRSLKEKTVVDETGPTLMTKHGPADKVKAPTVILHKEGAVKQRPPADDASSVYWWSDDTRYAKDKK